MKSPDAIKSWQLVPVKDEEIPEPGDPLDAPNPEFERLLAWFIKKRHRLAWQYGAEQIIVRPRYESDDPKKDLPGGIMLFDDHGVKVLKL